MSDHETTPLIPRADSRPKPRRNRRLAVAGAGAAVIAAAALGLSACGSSNNSSPAASPSSSSVSSPSAPSSTTTHQRGHGKHEKPPASGTIATESGNTWTITAKDGSTVTVTISADTAFGTAKQPQQQSDFAIGDRVQVRGTRTGTTVAATRIIHAHARPGSRTPGQIPPTGTPTPSSSTPPTS